MAGIIDPFEKQFFSSSVPSPDIAATGGQPMKDTTLSIQPATAPVSSLGPIVDPFETKTTTGPVAQPSSGIIDPFDRTTPKSLGDMLFPPSTPITPTPTPVEEPGYLGALTKGLYSGFRRRLPEMVGQAIQFAAPGETVPDAGKAISEWARRGEQRPEFKNILKDWIYQGAEMLAPSVAVPMAMGAAGAGLIPASIATGALFGLSQAQQTKETAQKAGVEPGLAPYAAGGIEAGGETIGTIALQRLFGPLAPIVKGGGKIAIRDVIKPSFSRMMKEFFGVTIPVETLTEIGQQVGEAGVEKYTGIRPDADLLKEGLSVIGPTFVLSAMTAGMAHPLNRIMSKRFEQALEDPNTPQEVRQQTVDSIAKVLSDADPNLGALWKIRGTIAVQDKESIPLDEDVSDWFKSPPKEAKPPTTPAEPQPTPAGPAAPVPTPPGAAPTPTPTPEAAPTAPGAQPQPAPPPPAPAPVFPPPAPAPVPSPTLPGLVPLEPGGVIRDEEIRSLAGQLMTGNPQEQQATLDKIKDMVANGTAVDDIMHNINNELLNHSLNKVQEAGKKVSEALGVVEPPSRLASPAPVPTPAVSQTPTPSPTPGVTPKVSPAPSQAVEPIKWDGPDWLEPGREVTFVHPNTERSVRGIVRDVTFGPPDGKTPVSITVSPKWKMDQKFDLPAGNVSEPTSIARMKEYHQALEGFHPADRLQISKNAKEFDRILLDNADLFVEPGMIDFLYQGANTPRQRAIASSEILNAARSEVGKALGMADPYNPIQRAESLQNLRDRIEQERPGATALLPEAKKPAAAPAPTTFTSKAPALPKAETDRGPVAEPTAPAAAPTPTPSPEVPAAPSPAPAKPPIVEPVKAAAPVSPEKPVSAPAETPLKPEAALARTFADELHRRLVAGDKPITNTELMIMGAGHFGGTRAEGKFTPRQAYDAMEMGVNKYLLEHKDEVTPALIDKIMRILPTETARTEEMQQFQQFSTPPNIAYVANWLANVTERDTFAETSAGNGSLAVFAEINGAKSLLLNELDKGRVENLKWLFPDAKVFNENAEHASDIIGPKLKAEERPTVVVINPPFSASGGRMPGKKILDIVNLHIEQGLKLLPENGRLVVITGRGFSLEAPTFRDFWSKLKANYTVQANVGLDGKNYKKYGTSFDIRMTVIDKTGPTSGEVYARDFTTTEEMLNDPKLQEIRNGRPEIKRTPAGEQPAAQPAIEAGATEGGGKAGPEPTLLGPTGGLVPGAPGPKTVAPGIPGPVAKPQGPAPEGPTVVAGAQPVGPGAGPGNIPGARPEAGLQPGRPGEPTPGQRGVQPGVGPAEQLPGATPQVLTHPAELTNSVFEFIPDQKHVVDGQELPQHRSDIVESAAHSVIPLPDLSSVKVNLKAENVGLGRTTVMSGAQMTMIKMAVKAHDRGLGFFNAGGTGFGKGLVNAAIIMNSILGGQKKAVWISASHNLIHATERDWMDVAGKKENILDFSNVKNTEQIEKRLSDKGVLYTTYSLLIQDTAAEDKQTRGSKSRLDQMIEWLGPNFDGVIVFDESHKMANALPERGNFGTQKPSKTSQVGMALQTALPNAKIVYSSATGATTLANLAYAQRLGIWGEGKPYPNIQEFLNRVAPFGLAGMEFVSADLKRNGSYWAPSLAFQGRTPEKTVTFGNLTHPLTPDQKETYNTIARQWQKVLNWRDEVMANTGASKSSSERALQNSIFWGAQQRFFNAMVMSMQLPTVFTEADRQLANNQTVILQLINTGEASQDRAMARMEEEQDLEELDRTPKDILLGYIENYFPIFKWELVLDPETGNEVARLVQDSAGNNVIDENAVKVKNELLADLASINFPENALDQIIDHFGADNVAEVTGRKERVVLKEEKPAKEKRNDKIVAKEVDEVREGKKKVLVFSGKGGTGESYDADYRIVNQQRRWHSMIQAGWSPTQFIQGVGRSHRASQVVAPHYAPVTTDLKAQERFNSAIASGLEQAGAVQLGQRQAREGFIGARSLDNDQAREALQRFWRDLWNGSVSGMSIEEYEKQTGLRLRTRDGQLRESGLPSMNQFLNRMLSMEIDVQNKVFDYFSNIMDRVIDEAARAGRLDLGIQNLHALKTEILSDRTVFTNQETGAQTKYLQIESTHEAKIFKYSPMASWSDSVVRNIKSGKVWAAGKSYAKTLADGSIERVVPLRSANYTTESIPLKEFNDPKRWSTISKDQVKAEWEKAVDEAPKTFTRKKHLLSGYLIGLLDRMSPDGGALRFQTPDGKRYIGKEILNKDLSATLGNLGAEQDPIKMTPTDVYENVMDSNRVVRLVNNWKFRRSRMTGEERLEVIGPSQTFNDSLRKMGVAVEYIQFKTRYFLPSNKITAVPILEKLLINRPIMEVNEAGSNKIFSITQREEPRLTTELTPDWKENLFDVNEYDATKAVEFLAKNSPVLENRTFFQALLSNKNVVDKLQQLPIAIVDTSQTPGAGLHAYYDSGDHRVIIDEDYFALSSKERLSGTILEEVVHGLAHNSMTAQDKLELQAILNRAVSYLPEKERAEARRSHPTYESIYLKQAGLTSQGRAVYYSLQNIDEFLAGAIRHPEMREFLNSIPQMEGISKSTNLWDRFTQWMSRVIFGDVENTSLLRQVLEKAGEIIERPFDTGIPTGIMPSMTRKTGAGEIPTKTTPMPGGGNVFYHGTRAEPFEVFNTEFGAFFSPSKKFAQTYTTPRQSQVLNRTTQKGKPRIVEATLDIKNPLDLSRFGSEEHIFNYNDAYLGNQAQSAQKLRELLGNPTNESLLDAIKKSGKFNEKIYENLYKKDPAQYALLEIFRLDEVEKFGKGTAHNLISGFRYEIKRGQEVMQERVDKQVKKFLEELGFDGIKFNDTGVGTLGNKNTGETIVAFRPDQIKILPSPPPIKGGELIERPQDYQLTGADKANQFFSIDDAPLPTQMQDNLDALTDPQLSHVAASDPGFINWLKDKMGILHIPQKNLGLIEQYLSLPYYMSKKYPIFQNLLKTQTTREEKSSNGIQEFFQSAKPFFTMRGNEMQKVEQALIQGDQEKVNYNKDTLRERFGLTETGIQSYQSVRSTLDTMLNRWIDHAEWAMLRPFEKRLSADEYQQLVSIYKQPLNPEEVAALPEKVGKAYNRLSPNVNLIKRLRSRIGELKGYFPRYRKAGKYFITVKRTEEDQAGNAKEVNIWTSFADSEWEMTKIVKELEADKEPGDKVIYGRHTQEQESSFFGTSDMNLQRLIDNSITKIKEEGKLDENSAMDLRLALSESLAETLMARGAGARMIKRSKTLIGGYETTGLQQVLKNYIVGYMGMETKQDAAFDFMDNLSTGEIRKNQPALFQEASHYVDTMLRNYDKQDQWFTKIRSLAFTYYLAGSIRAAAVQFTQNFVTGIPFLARETKGKGWLAAEREYIKAMWDISMGRFQTEDERLMDHEVLSRGIANDQMIRSISREVRGAMDEKWGKVVDILAYPFSKMEIWNRRSAALAAYRVYKDQGLGFAESLDKVRDFIYDTHYLMTKANLPHAARGGDIPAKMIGTAYTFRRFTHNYILSMIYSMRGPDGKFNFRNLDVFVRSLAWMAVFAGLSGLPFLDDLLDELEKLFGTPIRARIRQGLLSMGGEPLERAGVAGLPALLGQIPGMVGVDISGSLRLGLPSISDPTKGASDTVFGVWGGLGKKMANAWQSVGREDYLRAVEFASPVFIENILKAQRMTTMGATSPQGKILFDEKGRPIKETTGEGVAQVMGFRPERIAQASQHHREFGNIEARFTDRRNNLYAKFRLATDAAGRQDVILDVQRYNLEVSKYKGAIPLINADSLRRSFVQKPEKKYLLWGAQS